MSKRGDLCSPALLIDREGSHAATLQGHGRSAVTAAAILMAMGKADTVEDALTKVVKASAEEGERKAWA